MNLIYYQKNKEKILAFLDNYYNNKDKIKQKRSNLSQEEKDKRRNYQKEWQNKNLDYTKSYYPNFSQEKKNQTRAYSKNRYHTLLKASCWIYFLISCITI